MRGYTVPGNQTVTFTGPKAGAYQTSGLADILQAMSVVGSVNGGTGLKTITNLGKDLAKYFTDNIKSGDGGSIWTPSDLNLDEIDPI